ncbi:MAG: tRNA uridine-5-carboxymethylaminomethyl(34) synthesis GTPase MnmE, partial [Bacteroidota bacterium]|nr:tRNA uridine-5-carboxymethylaminomethyl(34) synthesis GTPase MnmE [Bacteroidota bacterium]
MIDQSTPETIVAIATPTGMGALGIIRLSGALALPIIRQLTNTLNINLKPRHAHLLNIYDTANGQILDQIIITYYPAPNSYTGQDLIELSLHGSGYILQRCMQIILELGARPALPGEFTQIAYLNGKMDLVQAEAIADLIASDSPISQQMAMNQLQGHMRNSINHLREQFIKFASLIELELDFAGEDVEFADRIALSLLINQIIIEITGMIESYKYGSALKEGIKVAILGKPNAGKSTLLNALLARERAIVSPIAGTTRDTVEDTLRLGDFSYRLIDTAGIRQTTDTIEQIGINRSISALMQADIVLYCVDIRQTEDAAHLQELLQLRSNTADETPRAPLRAATLYTHIDLASVTSVQNQPQGADTLYSSLADDNELKRNSLQDIN